MFQLFGPQFWWPSKSDCETLIGAILVQNTNWKNVEKSLCNLRNQTNFNPQLLSNLPLEQLKTLIKPSGFYNAKAQTIKAALAFIQQYQFDWQKITQHFSQTELRRQLLEIKGIGHETADVLLLYIFNFPVFIADTHARQLINSLESPTVPLKTYLQIKNYIEPQLLPKMSVKDFQEFHALIDDHLLDYLQLSQKTNCKSK